jgi:AraC-like DNA-binding protein
MDILIVLGAFQAFFFTILVISKRGKTISDKILALWLFIFSAHLAFVYFSFKMGYVFYIKYGYILSGVIVLYYSLMYIYTKSLVSDKQSFNIKWLLHIIPTIVVYIFIFPIAILPYNVKADLAIHPSNNLYYSFAFAAVLVFVTIYLLAILRLLKKHQVTIRKIFSFEEDINLNWLKLLAFLMVVLWIVISALVAYFYYLDANDLEMTLEDVMLLDMQGQSVFVIFVFLLSFFGIKQQIIYSSSIIEETSTQINDISLNTNQYKKSGLKKEQSEYYLKRLLKYMDEKRPYLNGKLLLKEVAEAMDISTNHLSQIINENLKINFFDFVNGYRVELIKQEMVNPKNKNYTIISIAYDCGFNSKSSFNSIFKKHTGLTPTEYIRNYKNDKLDV